MDSFFGIGLFELVMIAVVALLVLGPERLPGAMREVAKWMRQLRNLSSEFQSQFSEEFKMLDEINPRRIINEAIDPNAQPRSGAAGGVKQTPAATPARPPAPKPPANKPVKADVPDTAQAPLAATAKSGVGISNGEAQNSILPPATEIPAGPPENPVPPSDYAVDLDGGDLPHQSPGPEGEAEARQ